MPIDPREYDVSELRRVSRGTVSGADGDHDETGRRAPDRRRRPRAERARRFTGRGSDGAGDALRAAQFRELRELHSLAGGRKPYLPALPDAFSAEFAVVEWLEFLLSKAGYRGTLDALAYYARIGWISEAVREELRPYLRGLDAPAEAGRLDREAHRQSLVYIARLVSQSA